jgi:hypothetical protein
MPGVSTVVMFPLLSTFFTAGGVMIPASATQIELPWKVIAVGKFKPVAAAVMV